MIEQKRSKAASILIMSCILFSGVALAQQQQISLTEQSAADGLRLATLSYQVSDNKLTTGIGFRVHFDSRKVNVLEIESFMKLSNVGIQIMDDTDDLDNDPDTDSYINAAWVDLNGEWPADEVLPARLYSFTFDAVPLKTSDLFTITQSSSPVGFEFIATFDSNGTTRGQR